MVRFSHDERDSAEPKEYRVRVNVVDVREDDENTKTRRTEESDLIIEEEKWVTVTASSGFDAIQEAIDLSHERNEKWIVIDDERSPEQISDQ